MSEKITDSKTKLALASSIYLMKTGMSMIRQSMIHIEQQNKHRRKLLRNAIVAAEALDRGDIILAKSTLGYLLEDGAFKEYVKLDDYVCHLNSYIDRESGEVDRVSKVIECMD